MRRLRRGTGDMARFNGPAPQGRKRRPLRTRRRFGWGWIRHLPLLWLGALAVCAFLTYFLAGSGFFSVRTVRAGGALSREDIGRITAHCGCLGDNIFVVRADEIKLRLAAQLPTLVFDRVYTRLPNEVVVEGRPKAKVAIWRTPEAAYAVDANGEVLQVWKKPDPATLWKKMPDRWQGLPVFDEGYGGQFMLGHRLLVGDYVGASDLSYALSLGAAMPADLRAAIKQYRFRRYIGITVVGKKKWWALFSERDGVGDIALRVAALQQEWFGGNGAPPALHAGGCIDLRGPLGSHEQYIRPDHHCG
jgi:hypothetical protein